MLKDVTRVPAILAAHDSLATTLLDSSYFFAFAPIADTLTATVLRSKSLAASVPSSYRERWALVLEWMAESFFGVDAHYGKTCYAALVTMLAATGLSTDVRRVQRRMVEHMLACASVGSAMIGTSHASAALDLALTHGLPDLVEEAKKAVRGRVRASEFEMKTISVPLTIPAQALGEVDSAVDSAPSAVAAVRILAGLVGLCDIPVEATERAAREQLQASPFLATIASEHHRDGKVVFRGNDPAAKLREAVARSTSMHLAMVENLLHRALVRVQSRLTPETMVQAVAEWPWLDPKRIPWLQRASERFHAGDFMSSGLIVATQYEGVVRDLLRATGASGLKTDTDGVLMDETLGSLLSKQTLRAPLGEDHVSFVEYVMCDPEFGPNLRNELAHGSAAPWELTAPRVFLMWLFLVRLTFFAPSSARTEAS